MEINIGFRFSRKYTNIFGNEYWKTYEVIGSRYGNSDGGSYPDWKSRSDILRLKKYIQIIDLPYPNHNGLPGNHDDMTNSQLSMYWYPLSKLISEIEEDNKLKPEFKNIQIDGTV